LLPVILALAIGFFWVHGFTSSTFRNGKAATLKYSGLENFNPLIKIAKLRLALIFGWPGTCNFFCIFVWRELERNISLTARFSFDFV